MVKLALHPEYLKPFLTLSGIENGCPPAVTKEELENEPTETLIQVMGWRDQTEYAMAAQNALRVFTSRFEVDLVAACRVVCGKWGYDREVADTIAENTFARFWKYPKYEHARTRESSVDRGVLCYLLGIARRQLADFHAHRKDDAPYDGSENIIDSVDEALEPLRDCTPKRLKEARQKIESALKGLTWKHRVVFLTYLVHGKDGHYISRALSTKLQEALGITQNGIRLYKKQAFDQFKAVKEL